MLRREDIVGRVRGLTVERLDAWIERGWVVPLGGGTEAAFEEIDVARAELIRQLRDELEVNREAIPIVLSLIDQVYSLRRELRCIAGAVEEQPEKVREEIIAQIRVRRQPRG